jgi:hypothetical protein
LLAHFLLRRADALGFDDKFEEAEEEEIESEYEKPSAVLPAAHPPVPLLWAGSFLLLPATVCALTAGTRNRGTNALKGRKRGSGVDRESHRAVLILPFQ